MCEIIDTVFCCLILSCYSTIFKINCLFFAELRICQANIGNKQKESALKKVFNTLLLSRCCTLWTLGLHAHGAFVENEFSSLNIDVNGQPCSTVFISNTLCCQSDSFALLHHTLALCASPERRSFYHSSTGALAQLVAVNSNRYKFE